MLWKKLDILGVESYAAMRKYIWYGGSSRKTYNDVDRGFYESIMNEMLKMSLLTAIENGVYVESAYRVLSELALQEEDYHGAIGYFQKTRSITPYKDNSGFDLRLGSLYLTADQFADAEQSFVASLQTADRDRRLHEIWNCYWKKGCAESRCVG